MKLFVMHLSPFSFYFLPIMLKYPPYHPQLCSSLNVRDQTSYPHNRQNPSSTQTQYQQNTKNAMQDSTVA
jgi:hypothetical protein